MTTVLWREHVEIIEGGKIIYKDQNLLPVGTSLAQYSNKPVQAFFFPCEKGSIIVRDK